MEIVVQVIGAGTDEDARRPDTIAKKWRVVEDYGDTMKIEIIED